jgi:hypothetical protein
MQRWKKPKLSSQIFNHVKLLMCSSWIALAPWKHALVFWSLKLGICIVQILMVHFELLNIGVLNNFGLNFIGQLINCCALERVLLGPITSKHLAVWCVL